MTSEEITIELSLRFNGKWNDIYSELKNKTETIKEEDILNHKDLMSNAISLLSYTYYPASLREIDKPPFCIFYKGDINLLKSKKILSVIGSRNNTNYGASACKRLLSNLNKDIVIISGLAKGIDSLAHENAIKYGLKTIAVLGSGIDRIYPKENIELANKIVENGGLIISEYPNFVEPEKNNFIERNRIISGLSNTILLVESYGRSGALNTCISGLNVGKQIACVPYLIGNDSNCNKLIKDGAYLIESASDLNELLK